MRPLSSEVTETRYAIRKESILTNAMFSLLEQECQELGRECACVRVCVCDCVCDCVFVCRCVYVFMLYVYVCDCVCLCHCLWVCVCVWDCECECVCVCVPVSARFHSKSPAQPLALFQELFSPN